jgi:hypothetical protein
MWISAMREAAIIDPARTGISFAPLAAHDLMDIVAQDSQKLWLGTPGEPDWESAEALADQPVAWCARRGDGSVLACFGINELFESAHGVAWALLSQPIGELHLPLTRFIRRQVESAGLARIELLAKAIDIEATRAFFAEHGAPVDGWAMVQAAMSEPSPECRWALLLGFAPAHVLRKFGAAGETYMLFERITP